MLKPSLALVSAAALALVASTLSASEPPPAEPPSLTALTPVAATTDDGVDRAAVARAPEGGPARGLTNGIGVQGRWVIEVYDRDGGLARRHAFNNEYTDLDNALGRVLTRQATPGSLVVFLLGDACTQDGASSPCVIQEPGSKATVLAETTFALEASTSDRQITLEGAVIASRDGNVGGVGSGIATCPSSVAPAACLGAESMIAVLTQHPLAAAVPVLEGQQIRVEVQLAFAAAP